MVMLVFQQRDRLRTGTVYKTKERNSLRTVRLKYSRILAQVQK